MAVIKILAFGALVASIIVQYATKLAAQQEARHLRKLPQYADDRRFNIPGFTQHPAPAPAPDLLWGSLEGLPPSFLRLVRLHRLSSTVLALCAVAAFCAFAFGR